MSTGMGATTQSSLIVLESLKRQNSRLFLKSGRERVPTMRNTNEKLEQTVLNKRNQEDTPKMKVGGNQLKNLQGEERPQLRRKKKEFG